MGIFLLFPSSFFLLKSVKGTDRGSGPPRVWGRDTTTPRRRRETDRQTDRQASKTQANGHAREETKGRPRRQALQKTQALHDARRNVSRHRAPPAVHIHWEGMARATRLQPLGPSSRPRGKAQKPERKPKRSMRALPARLWGSRHGKVQLRRQGRRG